MAVGYFLHNKSAASENTKHYKFNIRNIIKHSRIKNVTFLKVLSKRLDTTHLNTLSKEELVDLCTKQELINIFDIYRKLLRKLATKCT